MKQEDSAIFIINQKAPDLVGSNLIEVISLMWSPWSLDHLVAQKLLEHKNTVAPAFLSALNILIGVLCGQLRVSSITIKDKERRYLFFLACIALLLVAVEAV